MTDLLDFWLAPVPLWGGAAAFSLADVVLLFLIPGAGLILLSKFMKWAVLRLGRHSHWPPALYRGLVTSVMVVRRLGLVIGFFWLLDNLFDSQWLPYLRSAYDFLNQSLYENGNTHITLLTLLLVIPALAVSVWLGGLVKELAESHLLANLKLPDAKRFGLAQFLKIFTILVAAIVSLSLLGIDLSTLGLLIGALGIGVGLGLQGTVQNFSAGMTLLFTQSLKEGDFISLSQGPAPVAGQVIKVRLLSTLVRTWVGETHVIPNNLLVSQPMVNLTFDNHEVAINLKVQVAYGTNLELALELLNKVGLTCPYRLPEKLPAAWVSGFGESGINLDLVVNLSELTDRRAATGWCNLEIWKILQENYIQIPFPQREVKVTLEPQAEGTPLGRR